MTPQEALIAAINDAADIRLPDGRLAIAREHAIAIIRAQPAPDPLREAAEVVVGRFLDTPASLAGVHVAALNDLRAALEAKP